MHPSTCNSTESKGHGAHRHGPCRLPALLAGILVFVFLAGCAGTREFASDWATSEALPAEVAVTPEAFAGARVLWGGKVIRVENAETHSEIEILAYPLDRRQEPVADDTGGGRFIALLPGYVEALDYPAGARVTLRGEITGVRSGRVGAAPYVFPLLATEQIRVWPAEPGGKASRVRFGVGVGIGIR